MNRLRHAKEDFFAVGACLFLRRANLEYKANTIKACGRKRVAMKSLAAHRPSSGSRGCVLLGSIVLQRDFSG